MENNKKIPEELLNLLHNIKAEDLQYGGEIKISGEAEVGEMIIEVPLYRYDDLMQKSTAYDILTDAIKASGKVDDDLVRAVTRTLSKEPMVPKKEADDYWGYFMREKAEKEKLGAQIADFRKANAELTEILRQNKIGPFAEEAGKEEGDNG